MDDLAWDRSNRGWLFGQLHCASPYFDAWAMRAGRLLLQAPPKIVLLLARWAESVLAGVLASPDEASATARGVCYTYETRSCLGVNCETTGVHKVNAC